MARRIAKRERAHRFSFIWAGVGAGLFVAGVAAFLDLVGALGLKSFLTLRLFGIKVVNRTGAPASRWHLFARWLLVWPAAIGTTVAVTALLREMANGEMAVPFAGGLAIAIMLVLAMDAVLICAVLCPAAGLQDRLARTRLVPL